jgi:hypothetical protein
VAGMKGLLGAYTGRSNRLHEVSGHLFSGRYSDIRHLLTSVIRHSDLADDGA